MDARLRLGLSMPWLLMGCALEAGAGGEPTPSSTALPVDDADCGGPLIFGHRGTRSVAPENTLEAFKWALDHGAEGVEIDVQRSLDGHPVALHDPTLERTSGGASTARADTLSLDELRALDVGAWFGADHAGARIPALSEVFAALEDRGGLYLLDVKDGQIAEALVEAVEAHGAAPRTLFAAADLAILERLHELAPHVPALYFMDDMSELDDLDLPSIAYLRVPRERERERALAERIAAADFGVVVGGSQLQWHDEGGPLTELAISDDVRRAVDRRRALRPAECHPVLTRF